MNSEAPQVTSESREARLAREYHEAVTRYHVLKEVTPEAKEIVNQDRPVANDTEYFMRGQSLQREALLGEAEAAAQKGEAYAERAFRMLEQMKEAETTILGLYFDAQHDSPELAELILAEHPWVATMVHDAGNDTSYDIEQKAA